MVYIDTSAKCPYYSKNDEEVRRRTKKCTEDGRRNIEETVRLIEVIEQTCWHNVRTVLRDGDIEVQDLVAFIGNLVFNLFDKSKEYINLESSNHIMKLFN